MSDLSLGYAFILHETPVVALPEALLWLPRSKTLVASDLHFEKGSAFAAKGTMLPPFDTAETLARLVRVLEALRPDTLIALGDSFHDVEADRRIGAADKDTLTALSASTPTIWIEGNHDPDVPAWLHGVRCANFHHDGLFFTHEPTGQVAGEVAGHLHPCARVTGKSGRTLRRRCFVSDGRTLVMPAFGAFTGGLSITDGAFDGLFATSPVALIANGTPRAPGSVRAVALGKVDVGV
jgi:DNA ligase-associated metallophosphoesterase